MNKKVYIAILVILVSLIVLCTFVIPYTSSKYAETKNQKFKLNISQPKYTVIFNANAGTGTMQNQEFTYGEAQALRQNTFTRDAHAFKFWNTKADGSGTTYQDKESVSNLSQVDGDEITLYAQWEPAIARIGTTIYSSLQDAINSVRNTDPTVIELLTNVTENLDVTNNRNITIDLKNNTVFCTEQTLLTNKGNLTVINGTLSSSSTNTATINNENDGTLNLDGVTVLMTAPGGKQAIYNNGGSLTISGNSYVKTEGSIRAAVHNANNNGVITITGGTIEAPRQAAVNNDKGTLVIGVKDGNPDKTSPILIGGTEGLTTKGNTSFYNGTIKGKSRAISDVSKIVDKEDDYQLTNGTELINGQTYRTTYLSITYTVTFDAQGGTPSEASRNIEQGDAIGTLPTCSRAGDIFDGWFRAVDGNDKIEATEIINSNVTFYAHWHQELACEMDGVQYNGIQEAINAAPNRVNKTITLIRDCTEDFIVPAGKDINLVVGQHTILSSANNTIVKNKGRIKIVGGTLISEGINATIDNDPNAYMELVDTNVFATGDRQALYNDNATVIISGNSVLKSKATGTQPNSNHLPRGTVQNITNGTVEIRSGVTVIGEVQQAISNEGTLILGTQDGSISASPDIRGETYGIVSGASNTIKFYDGTISGITDAVSGTINETETGTIAQDGTTEIDGKTYKTKTLVVSE